MFLAIINETYSEVKADFEVIPSQEFQLRDLFREVSNHFCNCIILFEVRGGILRYMTSKEL